MLGAGGGQRTKREVLTSLEETVPVSAATLLPRSFYYEINNSLLSFVFNLILLY